MKVKFNVNIKKLDELELNDVLKVFKAFDDFMCRHEENMTFAEAEKYWEKYNKVSEYIVDRFEINNPDEYIVNM